jgi:hypothetical protein
MAAKITGRPKVVATRKDNGMIPPRIPYQDRLTVSAAIASEMTTLSRSKIYLLLREGAIEGKLIGSRRLIVVASLIKYISTMPSAKRDQAV